jgi:dihydroxy-acid dehydratase
MLRQRRAANGGGEARPTATGSLRPWIAESTEQLGCCRTSNRKAGALCLCRGKWLIPWLSVSGYLMSTTRKLRSRAWFDNPANIDMTSLYLERYLNYGLSLEELRSGRPIIGIAQTGSDLSPCNRHHLVLAERLREGIREAGGIALEFPVHPIQETGKRPTAGLDRNLAYLGLVETLYGYPLDGVVLTIGCDKTTPACLMAAATVNIPAIALSVGPMLNGWFKGERTGSGTIVWKARQLLAAGTIDEAGFIKLVASSAPSTGYCNTMGTATTMNSLTEALGMSLPGSAAIPAPYRDRQEVAFHTGRRIVELVHADLKPSDIMTREAFLNAVVVNSALGGSTNAPIHLIAIARHMGVDHVLQDWQEFGHKVPLLVNLQPAGEYLGEDFYRAGGVPAVISQLMRQGLIREGALTVNGQTIGDNCRGASIEDERVIRPFESPLVTNAGFIVLKGNLFDAAIMKTSVISPEFRERYLSDPEDPDAFEGPAIVFDGPEDYHRRIDDPSLNITARTVMFMRGAGPIGYPGAAEVVNMRPPNYLIREGVGALPCVGDGRQSGTSASPSILNASPEAAANGGLALLRTGDRVRIDLRRGSANVLIDAVELAARQRALIESGGYVSPESQTPWQAMQRAVVGQLNTGAILEGAESYQRIAQTKGLPRDNH